MRGNVIAGVDESRESLVAAEWAAREAQRRELPLRLLHVWEWRQPLAAAVPEESSQREHAEHLLRQAEREVAERHPGLDLGGELREGPPVPTVLEAAEEAELLVLGSRGMGRLQGFLVGSVSSRVVAHVTRPTVLIRDLVQPAAEGEDLATKDVVAGVDTAERCDDILEFAFQASRSRGRGLHVLHTYAAPLLYGLTGYPVEADMERELEHEHRRLLDTELRPLRAKYPDVAVRVTVQPGQAALALVDAAAQAPLLVIGRNDRPVLPNLGSVAHAVMNHATSPVALVPHR